MAVNRLNVFSVESFRDVVTERLTAAAEEIFRVFQQTIVEYEEEIDRQRRLLDAVYKPEAKLHRLELPQQHVCDGKKILSAQHIFDLDQDPSLDHNNPMPPHVKEVQDEPCSRLVKEEVMMRQEADHFMLNITDLRSYSQTEPNDEQQLVSHNSPVTESQDQLLQIRVFKEEEVFNEQQVCNQDVKSSLDHEDPHPPQIKEDQQEPCSSQEGEQLVLKQETRSCEEPEAPSNPGLPQIKEEQEEPCSSLEGDQLVVKQETISCEELGAHTMQLLSDSSPVGENQDQTGSRGSGKTELMSNTECKTDAGKKSLKCDVCGKDFKDLSKLTRHFKIHTGKNTYPCDKCDKSFNLKHKLMIHMISHTGKEPHTCQICGKGFLYKNQCFNHMITQHREGPYQCKICGKRLKSNRGLVGHVRTHTGEAPYLCNFCGKGFKAKSILRIHIKTHTGEKPFSCDTCGKTFVRSQDMKLHIRTHTGEKPFSCEACGKSFVRNQQLKLHLGSHTGEKPYSCETCGKGFLTGQRLEAHTRTHTDEKPYACSSCGKTYKIKRSLLKHEAKHAKSVASQ